ncbi:MAG: hypothetical protein K0U52_14210 [Gammaproteobacteria bacterium]|jgi:hypothetical protein|nr:hypothetical protein [Gammaproteobacteria bacterium]
MKDAPKKKGKRAKLKKARRLTPERRTNHSPPVSGTIKSKVTLTKDEILKMGLHNLLSDTENFPLCMDLTFSHVDSFIGHILSKRQLPP